MWSERPQRDLNEQKQAKASRRFESCKRIPGAREMRGNDDEGEEGQLAEYVTDISRAIINLPES